MRPSLPRLLLTAALSAACLLATARADDFGLPMKGLKFAHKDDGAAAFASGQGDGQGKPLASTPHAIVAALSSAAKELHGGAWDFRNAGGDFPRSVEKEYSTFQSELSKLIKADGQLRYVETIAEKGGGVDKLNKWLQDRRLQLRLDPSYDKSALALAAIETVTVKWKLGGESTKLRLYDGSVVDAAKLSNPKFFENRRAMGREPIVELDGNEDEKVFFASYGNKLDNDATAAWREAKRLMDGMRPTQVPFQGVVFPKISFDSLKLNPNGKALAPLEKVCLTGAPAAYCVKQFVLEQRLKLDQNGATLGAAAGPGVPYELKGDFLVWVEVKGAIPFAGLITKPSMKDPSFDP